MIEIFLISKSGYQTINCWNIMRKVISWETEKIDKINFYLYYNILNFYSSHSICETVSFRIFANFIIVDLFILFFDKSKQTSLLFKNNISNSSEWLSLIPLFCKIKLDKHLISLIDSINSLKPAFVNFLTILIINKKH